MTKETYTSGGISFTSMLTVLFIGLKLTGHIGWSWWWVLSPFWISIGVGLAILVILLAIYGIVLLVGRLMK